MEAVFGSLSCFVSAINVADATASVVLLPALEANPRIETTLADQSLLEKVRTTSNLYLHS